MNRRGFLKWLPVLPAAAATVAAESKPKTTIPPYVLDMTRHMQQDMDKQVAKQDLKIFERPEIDGYVYGNWRITWTDWKGCMDSDVLCGQWLAAPADYYKRRDYYNRLTRVKDGRGPFIYASSGGLVDWYWPSDSFNVMHKFWPYRVVLWHTPEAERTAIQKQTFFDLIMFIDKAGV